MNTLSEFLRQGIDKWPLCGHYSELLQMASEKFSITKEEARKRFGLLTYREWNVLLNK